MSTSSWLLCKYWITLQRGIGATGGIKIACHLNLKYGDYPELSRSSNVITRVFMFLALKMERAMSKESGQSLEAGKDKGTDSC